MKGGSKLFIFAGVALALVAIVFGIASFSGGGKTDGADKTQATTKVTVVEALTDLPAHTVIQAKDIVEKQVDSSATTTGAATSAASVIGKAYSDPLYAGAILETAKLEVPGLSNTIDPGMRAIALQVDSVSAMSGLVQSGDYIDVIMHARISLTRVLSSAAGLDVLDSGNYKDEDKIVVSGNGEVPLAGDPGSHFVITDGNGDQQLVAKIMIQDVKVLRVIGAGAIVNSDGSTSSDSGKSGSSGSSKGQLILQVSPDQAEVLNFISDSSYSYQVILRAKDDHTKVNTTGVTLQILASDEEWGLPWPQSVTSVDGTTATVQQSQPSATPEAANASSSAKQKTSSGSNGSSAGNGS